ncbi:PyrD Dihydroorotate dehydrogenase [Candidatus Methylopumilus universalis]|uniref:quinone-dependent dihydroorotate dehydrogenase n=1 Tax=Candidatus Methylopumilus universalis TaxID=2588536 RepID=UPI003BEF46F3
MSHQLIRSLLFRFDAEFSHDLTLKALSLSNKMGLLSFLKAPHPSRLRTVMGIPFLNPVGLAAGLDKNASHIDALGKLGFGFIEVGTITPRPQPGNPRPRLFRLPEVQGIINRFGFNNIGVDAAVENIRLSKYKGVLGINIGKNFDTPIERAAEDYILCMKKVYQYANYIAVNISSPNTKNLRDLQETKALNILLGQLKQEQTRLNDYYGRYVPIALKISPDLTPKHLDAISKSIIKNRIDGVIATNTTVNRDSVSDLSNGKEAGGMSGKPLFDMSNSIIRELYLRLQGEVPIIGVGGISSGEDAAEKINAGAELVQMYSGLIYQGRKLILDACHSIG